MISNFLSNSNVFASPDSGWWTKKQDQATGSQRLVVDGYMPRHLGCHTPAVIISLIEGSNIRLAVGEVRVNTLHWPWNYFISFFKIEPVSEFECWNLQVPVKQLNPRNLARSRQIPAGLDWYWPRWLLKRFQRAKLLLFLHISRSLLSEMISIGVSEKSILAGMIFQWNFDEIPK